MRNQLAFLISFLSLSIFAQDALLGDLQWRNIGPANQGGRITDVEARPNNFADVWIAIASGGVWHSENAGTTWEPVFDDYETASIGDIALDPNNKNTIWVGTGESNNRNSVSWGNGIYKSSDGGKSFQNLGLQSTHAIGRVLVNPKQSDDVCVCATGHLWGYEGDRGLFQTMDGGKTWKKLINGLPNDGKTGCTDLIRDSKNPNVMYAAFYHRLRQPWHFHSGGEKGGIYKSIDNGKTWTQLTNGLPTPTGRIGLAISQQNPDVVMALVEAKKSNTLRTAGSGVYRSEDGGASWKYVNTYNNRPFYYSQIRINPTNDQKVYLLTTRFMVSDDGGNTFKNGSADQEVHGDFHSMWLDPNDGKRFYLGADKGFSITHDEGQHFRLIDNLPIAQYYRINYDMQKPYYVYGGLQDNGSYATASFGRDARGILSDQNWKMHWGDGQYAEINPYDHTDMYTSMENGSFYKYNPETRDIKRISPFAGNTINYWDYFDPNEKDKASANRFNWSAPLIMSSHNPKHIYVAGNHVYRSMNSGQSWTIISPDLSMNDPVKRKRGNSGGITPDNTGAETNNAVFTLSESPINPNIIWAGTDDGLVQFTKNGGKNWLNVTINIPSVPKGLYVSRVVASHFDPARAYICFDGHRSDNFDPHVFRTDDYGRTWRKITTGLHAGHVVRVIIEDHRNPNLLFVGTEVGIFYTIDRGQTWKSMKQNMPTVSVYDLKIHRRDNDLIAGTHGRSLWIMDDISSLQQLTDEKVQLFNPPSATLWKNISRGGQRGHFLFAGENPKTIRNTSSVPRAGFESLAAIQYYSSDSTVDLSLTISDVNGNRQIKIPIPNKGGIQQYLWNLEFESFSYTPKESKTAKSIWDSMLANISSNSLRRIYGRFLQAKTPREKRQAIGFLSSGYLSFKIPEELLVPKAGVGVYELKLKYGEEVLKTTLEIIEDDLDR